ncbi:MAG: hypothetical protein M0R06_04005 [Sphaerochaeta sp.]|nr:hypothetical protein [Sphaerochaeta sp.]
MQASKMTDDELRIAMSWGAEAREFRDNNPLYVKHIKPGIEKAVSKALRNGSWRPGSTHEVGAVALCSAYNSGMAAGNDLIEVILGRMIADGEEAKKEIAIREKKNAVQK